MAMDPAPQGRRGGWYYGWNIVGVCVLAQIAANGVPANALSLFLTPWSQDLHVPISAILLALLAMIVVASLSAPLVGAWADSKPARLLMGIGVAGLAVVCLAVSTVTQAWQLLALYALGLPMAVSLSTAVVCNPLVSRWFVKRAGLALGITSFGIGAAGIVLPPLIAHLMPIVGWRGIWRGTGIIIGLVVLPIVLLVLRDRPTEREGLHYVTGEGVAQTAPHGAGGGQLRATDILRRKNFLLIAGAFIAIGCMFMAGMQNIVPIALGRGFDQMTAGLLISVLSTSYVVATLLMGAMYDRVGNRAPLVLLSLMASASALLLGFGSGLSSLVAGAALAGFCGGMYPVLAAALGVEFGANDVGRAYGLLSMLTLVPAMTPSVIARVQELTGSYRPALMGLAVLGVVGAALALQLRERRDPNVAPATVAA
jgi:MFS family permease